MSRHNVILAMNNEDKKSKLCQLLSHYPAFTPSALVSQYKQISDDCHTLKADALFLDSEFFPSTATLNALIKTIPHYTRIVLVGDNDKFASTSYELGIVDYLVFPISNERFNKCIEKLDERLSFASLNTLREVKSLLNELVKEKQHHQYITIKDVSTIKVIEHEDILWLNSAGNYVELHLASEERPLLHKESLTSMEHRLKHSGFARIHRSTVVKKRAIKEFKATDNGDYRITLKNGVQLNLSRRYKSELSDYLK